MELRTIRDLRMFVKPEPVTLRCRHITQLPWYDVWVYSYLAMTSYYTVALIWCMSVQLTCDDVKLHSYLDMTYDYTVTLGWRHITQLPWYDVWVYSYLAMTSWPPCSASRLKCWVEYWIVGGITVIVCISSFSISSSTCIGLVEVML